jgi:hypothetical protein
MAIGRSTGGSQLAASEDRQLAAEKYQTTEKKMQVHSPRKRSTIFVKFLKGLHGSTLPFGPPVPLSNSLFQELCDEHQFHHPKHHTVMMTDDHHRTACCLLLSTPIRVRHT